MKKITLIIFSLFLMQNSSNTFGAIVIKETQFLSEKEIQNQSDNQKAISDEQLQSLLNETGKPLFSKKDISDSLETDVMNERILSGYNAYDNYGYSVSDAGDVNGDGFEDIIIGEPYNDGGGISAGRAYIYFGGTMFNSIPDVTLTGELAGNSFGYSVSSAGDVNGDSYADIIVGAPYYDNSTGRAYIFFGGAVVNNAADLILHGADENNQFGISVSSAGNVNGDGFSDVIVGATGFGNNTGRAYVYYGGTVMNNGADVILTGNINTLFGCSVSDAGDVNSDGFSDVIIGGYGYSSYTGRAYIYYGSSPMNTTADVIMTGEATSNYFGTSVSSAGDVNGDGFKDVIVGAKGINSDKGRVYIFHGGTGMNSIADLKINGESADNHFGTSVSNLGDINQDGFEDIIAGAMYPSNGGRAYIYKGGVSMDTVRDKILSGEAAYDGFGSSVSYAGDINGDSIPDVLIGSPYNDASGFDAGRAFVYMISELGNDTEDLKFTGEGTNNSFGYTTSSAGDVNGDGFSDIVAGASNYNNGDGRAYIFFGGPAMDNLADITFLSQSAGSEFGISVSSAGDVNGDGFSDVIVGAYRFYPSLGRAYIFYGGSSMNNTADVIFTGETSTYLGNCVSTAGDVNGDGYSDVIISELYLNGRGRVQIYLGGASMNNIPDVTMVGEMTQSYMGHSASTAGDVNGDGYSDVIVGADGYNSSTGRAYIYFGGTNMNNVADVIMNGEAVSNSFGYSVSGSGDINGDGFSDVIVSAYRYNGSTGRAYIYFGGTNMNNIPDVTMTSETIENSFGISVSVAGDINDDGYSDVIVGAQRYSGYTGRAYIFFGGSSMNNISDITMTGEAANNFLGFSVSGAGDVNGDGLSDVIAGAHGFNNNTGRVYLFMSSHPNVNNSYGLIDLKIIKEGFYDASLNNMRMSDTLRIYLRNQTSPYAIIDSSKAVINSTTFSGLFQIHNAPSGTYYIQVIHRNTIETWSGAGITYTENATHSYNFTTSPAQAFGNNIKLVDTSPVRYGIFSGDPNQDDIVDISDIILIYNNGVNFVSGYVASDVNGDNFTDVSDLIITYNNSNNFVRVIRP